MKLKKTLIIIFSIFVLIIAGGYFLLTNFLEAVKQECDVKIIAKTSEYEVRDKSCIGFAGPRYSTYHLYENGMHIGTGEKVDSCSIRFQTNHLTLDLDTCANKLTKSKK
jgi:hypothetical protein